LEMYSERLTKGVLLVTGGVFACMVGGHVCRATWRRGSSTRLGHVLLVGGCLLVAAGLAVFTRHTSIAGFYVGFGIQVAGAVAVGVGGSGSRGRIPLTGLPAIGGRCAGRAPRGGSDATPPE
jgi:hypothetical protein